MQQLKEHNPGPGQGSKLLPLCRAGDSIGATTATRPSISSRHVDARPSSHHPLSRATATATSSDQTQKTHLVKASQQAGDAPLNILLGQAGAGSIAAHGNGASDTRDRGDRDSL